MGRAWEEMQPRDESIRSRDGNAPPARPAPPNAAIAVALTRSRVSPHNRASGAVVVLAGGERPQPRLKIPMVPPEVGGSMASPWPHYARRRS